MNRAQLEHVIRAAATIAGDSEIVVIEGSIGELSPFHETYGYYAQAVGERTAILPEGWEARVVSVPTPAGSGLCLHSQIDADFAGA